MDVMKPIREAIKEGLKGELEKIAQEFKLVAEDSALIHGTLEGYHDKISELEKEILELKEQMRAKFP